MRRRSRDVRAMVISQGNLFEVTAAPLLWYSIHFGVGWVCLLSPKKKKKEEEEVVTAALTWGRQQNLTYYYLDSVSKPPNLALRKSPKVTNSVITARR